MEVGKLTVKRRYETGKGTARRLRTTGKVPGVCYGATLDQPLSLEVDARSFRSSLDPVRRQNTVIELTVEEDGQPAKNLTVMVKDYQIDLIRRDLSHVDFLSVDKDQLVDVEVPLELSGKHKGVLAGATLHVVRHDLAIRCRPADIPEKVVVDITSLDVGGVIHVSDLALPSGVSAAVAGHLTVVTCVAPEIEAASEGAEAKAS